MTIKSRLDKAEREMGTGEDVRIAFFNTLYERKNGGEGFENAQAVVVGSSYFDANYTCFQSNPGETPEDFEERVRSEVEANTT